MNQKYLDQFNSHITGPQGSPRLVFLHGLMGSAANWRRVVSALEGKFQILVYDQRGHGRSFHPQEGFGVEALAEDLKKILVELGWSKISLVGHSMGGRAALNFATRHPEMLESLVIEDIGPQSDPGPRERTREMILSVPVPFGSRMEAKSFFEGEFSKKYGTTLARFFFSNLSEAQGGWSWRFSLPMVLGSLDSAAPKDPWGEWKNIKTRGLLIRGENSDYLSRSTFDRMLKENRHFQGVEIRDAGHWVHFDQAQAFIEALKNFLPSKSLSL